MAGLKKSIKNTINLLKEEKKIPIIQVRDSNHLLAGKIALITGGSGGIGKAIAEAFLRSGCKIIIQGRNENKLIKLVNEFENPENVKYLVMDITNISSLEERIHEAAQLFPEKRIDVLVNAAGVIDDKTFFTVSESDFDRVIAANLKGTFFVSQTVSKMMIEKGNGGHIMNISSSSALRPASTPYQLSKWGICGLTKGLADCLIPYGIVVNAIAPGPTATPMLGVDSSETIALERSPAGRYVLPEEIANLAVFLTSGAGDMIVGDTYYITGGSGTISMHN